MWWWFFTEHRDCGVVETCRNQSHPTLKRAQEDLRLLLPETSAPGLLYNCLLVHRKQRPLQPLGRSIGTVHVVSFGASEPNEKEVGSL